MKKNRVCILLAVAIGFLACSMRWISLDHIQDRIFDEVHYIPAAEVLTGLKPHPGMGVWSFHPLIGKAPAPNFEHPLLAKFMIGAGMLLFGDQAYGWRFASCLIGTLSLGLIALLAFRVFGDRRLMLLALALIGFDSLHILHSRIAMLDIFLFAAVTFLLISTHALIDDTKRWKPRLCAALALALGFSIKWVFAFAVLGFCWCLLCLGRGSWRERCRSLLLVGLIALGFYQLWFFYYAAHGFTWLEWLEFHLAANSATTGKLAPHPYGASAFSMLLNSRNIWYYFKKLPDHTFLGLVGLMNPALIYATIPALLLLIYNYWKARDRTDAFILGWFACCYLPFYLVLLQRQGFVYYLLLLEPIIVLAVCRSWQLLAHKKPWRLWLALYLTSFSALMIFTLPVVLGLPMSSHRYLAIIRLTGF